VLSVIVPTYNRPAALAKVLSAFELQQYRDFELLIADDGSSIETSDLIAEMKERLSYPLQHLWQEDQGFRAAMVRNRAVAAAKGDYLVFVDGDCIPLPDFLSRHHALAQANCFVAGNRVLFDEAFTQQVLDRDLPVCSWSFMRWLFARLRTEINRFAPIVRLPDGSFRHRQPRRWQGVRTCNLGVWRSDVLRVNGFDESYQGWGHEDADLAVRLIRANIFRKDGRFSVPVLHLWHQENDRSTLEENEQRLAAIIDSETVLAKQGVDQYLS